MSRIGYRLDIEAWLEFLDPVHVGGLDGNQDTDLALIVDSSGRFLIPGTSLAGALRHLSEGDVEPEDSPLRCWWGYVAPGQSDEGQAARIMVHDGVVLAGLDDIEPFAEAVSDDPAAPVPTPIPVEYIDGVGIDRMTGAAADRTLFSRQVLPAGCVIPLGLRIECPTSDRDEARLLARDLLRAIEGRHLAVGAAVSRGLGRVGLVVALSRRQEIDLATRTGLLDSLAAGWQPIEPLLTVEGEAVFTPLASAEITVDWEPTAPVMVKSGAAGQVVDAIPVAARTVNGELRVKIPGSSIKGALRSTAERILATVLGVDLTPVALSGGRSGFLDQLNHEAFELSRVLFGTEGKSKPDGADATDRPAPPEEDALGRSAVTVSDCWADRALDPDAWAALTVPTEKGHDTTIDERVTDAGMARADRVAIDRWTSGAAEGLLYSVLEPHGLGWEPLSIRVEPGRMAALGAEVEPAAWALLYLTLRELRCGRVTIGYGSNRGQGAIRVDAVTFTGVPRATSPFELLEAPRDVLDHWASGWSTYQDQREAA